MSGHAARTHATWSASTTERNWNCPGALILNSGQKEDESEASAWGTACHEVAEWCLKEGRDAIEAVGRVIVTKAHKIEVDEEMAETAQTYVDYVRERIAIYHDDTGGEAILFVEQKFSLAPINPPFDAGGTGDAVLFFPAWLLLEIVDLKGGRGVVVEAKGNKQLRTYALGAMLKNAGLSVARVRSTIVQPRAPHRDGRIRFEEYSVIDLMEWTGDLREAMTRSAQAAADLEKVTGGVTMDEWASLHLSAGPHCKFCKAKPTCRAVEKQVFETAGIVFDDLDRPTLTNTPDKMEPEQIARTLDLLDMVDEWTKAVRAFSHAQAESGVTIPGYVLVPKQGREKWKDEAAVSATLALLEVPDDLYLNEPKARTPKQVRTALKKAGRSDALEAVEGQSETPSDGTNLVRADKTTRESVTSKAERFFGAPA